MTWEWSQDSRFPGMQVRRGRELVWEEAVVLRKGHSSAGDTAGGPRKERTVGPEGARSVVATCCPDPTLGSWACRIPVAVGGRGRRHCPLLSSTVGGTAALRPCSHCATAVERTASCSSWSGDRMEGQCLGSPDGLLTIQWGNSCYLPFFKKNISEY